VDICHGYRILVANSSWACVVLSYQKTTKIYSENYYICAAGRAIKHKAQKIIEGKIKLRMFGKAKCRLCGDEVRLALKHLRDKHMEIYRREVTSKTKMSGVMKKYFVDY
jgi:hypothetical protein